MAYFRSSIVVLFFNSRAIISVIPTPLHPVGVISDEFIRITGQSHIFAKWRIISDFPLPVGPVITFNVLGNGHGLGLSQVGADYYGKNGMSYIDIIKHYYTGVEVVKID